MNSCALEPAGSREIAAPVEPARQPVLLAEPVRQFSLELGTGDARVNAIPLPAELERAVPKRQLHFRAGRLCAKEALEALEPRRGAMPVPRGAGGVPVWPIGIVGSITHTDGFASAAVARTSDVAAIGIDTEAIVSSARASNVAQAVAWACELAHARRAGCDRLEALTLVFSAKESIFKALYPTVGRLFGFHDVRIVGVDGRAGTFTARVVKTLSERFPADTMLEGRFEIDESRVHTGIALAPLRPGC